MAFCSEFCLAISRAEQWLERINLSRRRIPIRSFRIRNADASVRDKLTNGRRLALDAYKMPEAGLPTWDASEKPIRGMKRDAPSRCGE